MKKNSGYIVEAVVEFNAGEALVLNKLPQIRYEKRGPYLLGIDEHGVFLGVYKYHAPTMNFRAFGGHRFNIPMIDGSVTKADGQWWDAGFGALESAIGGDVIHGGCDE